MTWKDKMFIALLPPLALLGIACQGQEAPKAMMDGATKVNATVADPRPPIDIGASKKSFETATFALG